MSAKIYKYYYDDLYYPKSSYVHPTNGYLYVSITCKDGVNRNRRVHVLMAQTFLFNPNPLKYKVIGHKDNDKTNPSLDNLYWTDTQLNTQKAVEDGLNINRKAEDNELSKFVIVIDKNTKQVAGVYGSMRECARCIDNINLGTISKACKNQNHRPRLRKYIYRNCTREEFDSYPNLQNCHLIENPKNVKQFRIFRMSNNNMKYSGIFDNQVTASKVSGIPQAIISKILRNKVKSYNGWDFEFIKDISYTDSSAYNNQLLTVEGYTIRNINTGQILEFNSGQELKDYFGLKGHDVKHYLKTDQILMSEWKIVSTNKKIFFEEKAV